MKLNRTVKEINPKEIFTDITEEVSKVIKDENFLEGLAIIYTYHTTANIKILENELLLKQDMQLFFEKLAPKDAYYAHNDIVNRNVPPEERLNGHSHIRSLILNNQEIIPVVDGQLDIGQWQRIFFIDTDLGKTNRRYGIILI